MNKKLIAAAIAAAMVSPAAFANATLYGKFHVSVDSQDIEQKDAAGNKAEIDNWVQRSRSSRVGVKGSEDLGGGLKAIYQAEFTVNVDGNEGTSGGSCSGLCGQDGGDGWGGQRNTFIGLAGGFGTFLVGRHDTPAKVAFYAAGTEVLGDSIIDLNSGVTGAFHEFRADNTITYVSPNFSGFTFAASVIPGEDSGQALTTTTTTNVLNASLYGLAASTTTTPAVGFIADKNDRDGIADHYAVGLMYAGGGLKASVGYESLALQDSAVAEDQDTLQVGASYTFGAFKVGVHYEDQDNVGGDDGVEKEAWGVVGKATFGNNAISLVYTNAEIDGGSGAQEFELDGDAWGIAAEHNFSKRTKVYAAYATNEVEADYTDPADDEDREADVFSLGMIHNF
ncbi:MAG: porin [Gammaproteobacteria bacterium]|nr:porin [Gammaproteobacteria bacterium]